MISPPSSVNFTALLSRLISTRSSWPAVAEHDDRLVGALERRGSRSRRDASIGRSASSPWASRAAARSTALALPARRRRTRGRPSISRSLADARSAARRCGRWSSSSGSCSGQRLDRPSRRAASRCSRRCWSTGVRSSWLTVETNSFLAASSWRSRSTALALLLERGDQHLLAVALLGDVAADAEVADLLADHVLDHADGRRHGRPACRRTAPTSSRGSAGRRPGRRP